MPRTRGGAASRLLQRRWGHPTAGTVTLVRPSRAELRSIDEGWEALRAAGDVAKGWSWASVAQDSDLFLLRTEPAKEPLAIWRAAKPTITLGGQRLYRLDNIETNPSLRNAGTGRMVMLLICARALELQSEGVILAAPPVRESWYRDIGATSAPQVEWLVPAGLMALWFEPGRMTQLKEAADALEVAEGS